MGVSAVIFGSLAEDPGIFRSDSDVDLCLLGPVKSMSEIEFVAHKHFGLVKCDLVEFGHASQGVRERIIRTGLTHAK